MSIERVKETRIRRMRTLTALLTVALMATQIQAGTRFETGANIAIDTLTLNDMVVTTAGIATAMRDSVPVWHTTAEAVTSMIWHPERDTIENYISGIDTVIKLDRIECDTVGLKFVEFDSVTTRAHWKAITCDTVYSVTFVDIWSPKRLLYLKPNQYDKLMELLK